MEETFTRIQACCEDTFAPMQKRSLRACSDASLAAWIRTFHPAVPSPPHLTTTHLFYTSTSPFSVHDSFIKRDLHGPRKEMNIRSALAMG